MTSLGFLGKFIGSEEIVSVETSNQKTPGDNSILEFTFKSGKTEKYPEKTVPHIVTDKATDATTVQERRLMLVVRDCVATAMEYDMNYMDIEPFIRQLHQNLMLQYDRAENFMWKGVEADKEFAPGYDVRNDVSLLDVHQVLESIENGKSDTEHTEDSN